MFWTVSAHRFAGIRAGMDADVATREQTAMHQVTDRLVSTFGADRGAQEVARTIDEIHHRFDGRPIRDFVPVLVERYARQRLTAA
ncbi:three-helix bundle dimerization domain-containing protein [Actinomadura parmotrematis]|uniref:Uncharacterized protein n=1 Tax=Actinomadura parmotrematis TaxID=2864039 RepID=A0ABS7FQ92_9ACTN|nr:hypothetical protein [Actinomadura parmotrematis]MBW8482563.1 hypothetical protein [Actinomadura parmotrematis]